jgi:hypothetical protein
MAVEPADRLIVVMEQGVFAGVALNGIDRIINSMTRTAVIFLSQTGYLRRNS